MTNRERAMAVLNYKNYDRLPLVHFGYWQETLDKWHTEGHLKVEEISGIADGNFKDKAIAKKLGFDFNWFNVIMEKSGMGSLVPMFESRVIEELPDGMQKVLNPEGVTILVKPGVSSISSEIGHLLTDRKSWEEHFLPKLQFSEDRINYEALGKLLDDSDREEPLGIYCGSLFGQIRNWMGFTGISYLYADDEDLFDEIIETVGSICYKVTEAMLLSGAKFDFAHYWEDICFKNGPLVKPSVFYEKVGPQYRKINELVSKYDINIVSLDCDGLIDSLIPTWIENGVNTMFPIEIGTWDANIKPWREKYGNKIRGVGGMNKTVFAHDYAAIDSEIERLRPQVELGGFIPCPDHRIAPDAKWENIQYYCDRMRRIYG